VALALVRDLREHRVPASAEELADFETDVLAGFVLARGSEGWVEARSAATLPPRPAIGAASIAGKRAASARARSRNSRPGSGWPNSTST
jgi:hypothetical protein